MQRVNSKVQNYDGFIALEWEQDREKKRYQGNPGSISHYLLISYRTINRTVLREAAVIFFVIHFSINEPRIIAK